MMWIFYIDWQQYWKCDWTMNIGANRNAHGKQTVSTKQPQVWQLGFQTLERYWASFQVTRLFQCDQFFQPGQLLEWRVFHCFFFRGGGGGGGSASMHLLFGAVNQWKQVTPAPCNTGPLHTGPLSTTAPSHTGPQPHRPSVPWTVLNTTKSIYDYWVHCINEFV